MNESLAKIFELSKSETRVLFSLEHWLIQLDINATTDQKVMERKRTWLAKWEENLFKKKFFGLVGEDPPSSEEVAIKRLQTIKDTNKKILLLCEGLVFNPYFNIQIRDATNLQDQIDDINRNAWRENLSLIAKKLGVETTLLEKWESAYTNALEGIGGRSELWKKASWVVLASVAFAITGGIAAPVIGGVIGGLMGLSGAAATSAGLAFLGGGAIAAGGFGMAGGTIAIIGGGAIFGGLGSIATSRFFFLQNKIVLSQLAKLEATMLTFFNTEDKFIYLLSEIIDAQITALRDLNREIASTELEDEERKRLKKTASYYTESIKRLNEIKLKQAV